MTLNELATKYGTDKGPGHHNYTAVYEQMFDGIRNEPLKILEIGIGTGASLKVWLDYFPNADIHGVDVSLEQLQEINNERLTIHVGDQGDRDFLDTLQDFDIVIDDGSHRVSDQIFSFKALWPNTRLIYIVEDMYSSYLKRYGGGYRRSGTAVEFFKDLVDDVNVTRFHDKPKSAMPFSYNDIGMIQFYPALVCLYKRK